MPNSIAFCEMVCDLPSNGLAWHKTVKRDIKWFSVTSIDYRRNRQKYKNEMEQPVVKWSSPCGVWRHGCGFWREHSSRTLCSHTNKLRFLFEENSGCFYLFLFTVVNYFMANRLTWCRLRVQCWTGVFAVNPTTCSSSFISTVSLSRTMILLFYSVELTFRVFSSMLRGSDFSCFVRKATGNENVIFWFFTFIHRMCQWCVQQR